MIEGGKRLAAVDFARGFAVLLMVIIHVLEVYSTPEVFDSLFAQIIKFVSEPLGAPMFMYAMGISFYYSRNKDMKLGIIRGLKIIILGYILNFFRDVLPLFLVKSLAPARFASLPEGVTSFSDAILGLDILQFAGLALMVMAVIREYKVNKYFLLIIAVVIAVVSPALWGIQSDVPIANHLLDYLWGDKPSLEQSIGNLVAFPFFPWFTYVIVGMFLGDTLVTSKNSSKVFMISGIIGGAIAISSLIFMWPNLEYHINDFYHSRPLNVTFVAGMIPFWFFICNLFCEKVKFMELIKILNYWSKNVTSIYFIQWVLIMTGAYAFSEFNKSSYLQTYILMAMMLLLTYVTNNIYLKLMAKSSAAKVTKQ